MARGRPPKSPTQKKMDVIVRTRVDDDAAEKLDRLVEHGHLGGRGDLVRDALEQYFDRHRDLLSEEAA